MNVVRTMQTAVQLHQAGQLDQAEQMYRQVLAVAPRDPDALHLLGMIEHQRGRHAEAQQLIRKATQIKPTEATFYVNLAQVNWSLGRFDEAEICLRRAIDLDPRLPDAHSNLGALLRLKKRLDEAEASGRRAVELNPRSGSALMNLGAVIKDKGRLTEAMELFKRAEQLGAPRHLVLTNIGDAARAMGHIDQGKAALEEAIKLAPNMAAAHWNLSLIYLHEGDYPRGFSENEWRLKVFGAEAHRFGQPIWDGSELNGRSILIHAEQGFGDSFQFIRYAPMVAQRGGKVLVECQRPLRDILRSVNGVHQVMARGEPIPPFDVQAPILSLSRIFHTTLQTIPMDIPYIRADEQKVAKWRDRLADGSSAKKIGLVWAGNPEQSNDRNRSMPAMEFAPLAQMSDVRWFSLQVGPAASQPKPPEMNIVDLSPELTDFSETAAAMQAMDLLVMVDTAPAHLAGAMGLPVWIMLCHLPDWRYQPATEQCAWYPTARLFGQTSPGNWRSVIDQVIAALRSSK